MVGDDFYISKSQAPTSRIQAGSSLGAACMVGDGEGEVENCLEWGVGGVVTGVQEEWFLLFPISMLSYPG